MDKRGQTFHRRKETFVGNGGVISTLLNKAIDLLPFEAHLPTFRFCGPGTKLAKRLARGDKGINPLDEACKIHDIAYSKYSDSESRRKADGELAERSWQRFKASDSSLGEKAAAWVVTTAMKAKTALGGGKRRKRSVKRKRGKGLYLKPYSRQGEGLRLKPYNGGGGGGKIKKRRTVRKKKHRRSR